MVADRFSLKITLRDCIEVVGAGRQQVRFVWSNVGAFHVCLETFATTESWAGRRRTQRRALLGGEIRAPQSPRDSDAEIQATIERLLSLDA